jgi:hypothetical protein
MNIAVSPHYFDANSEAQQTLEQAVKQDGLHSVSMFVPPVKNSSHWHRFSTSLYILEGQLKITDVMLGKTHTAGPGCRVDVPARVLHAEESGQGYRIVAGMTVDPASLTGPVDLAPRLLESEES